MSTVNPMIDARNKQAKYRWVELMSLNLKKLKDHIRKLVPEPDNDGKSFTMSDEMIEKQKELGSYRKNMAFQYLLNPRSVWDIEPMRYSLLKPQWYAKHVFETFENETTNSLKNVAHAQYCVPILTDILFNRVTKFFDENNIKSIFETLVEYYKVADFRYKGLKNNKHLYLGDYKTIFEQEKIIEKFSNIAQKSSDFTYGHDHNGLGVIFKQGDVVSNDKRAISYYLRGVEYDVQVSLTTFQLDEDRFEYNNPERASPVRVNWFNENIQVLKHLQIIITNQEKNQIHTITFHQHIPHAAVVYACTEKEPFLPPRGVLFPHNNTTTYRFSEIDLMNLCFDHLNIPEIKSNIDAQESNKYNDAHVIFHRIHSFDVYVIQVDADIYSCVIVHYPLVNIPYLDEEYMQFYKQVSAKIEYRKNPVSVKNNQNEVYTIEMTDTHHGNPDIAVIETDGNESVMEKMQAPTPSTVEFTPPPDAQDKQVAIVLANGEIFKAKFRNHYEVVRTPDKKKYFMYFPENLVFEAFPIKNGSYFYYDHKLGLFHVIDHQFNYESLDIPWGDYIFLWDGQIYRIKTEADYNTKIVNIDRECKKIHLQNTLSNFIKYNNEYYFFINRIFYKVAVYGKICHTPNGQFWYICPDGDHITRFHIPIQENNMKQAISGFFFADEKWHYQRPDGFIEDFNLSDPAQIIKTSDGVEWKLDTEQGVFYNANVKEQHVFRPPLQKEVDGKMLKEQIMVLFDKASLEFGTYLRKAKIQLQYNAETKTLVTHDDEYIISINGNQWLITYLQNTIYNAVDINPDDANQTEPSTRCEILGLYDTTNQNDVLRTNTLSTLSGSNTSVDQSLVPCIHHYITQKYLAIAFTCHIQEELSGFEQILRKHVYLMKPNWNLDSTLSFTHKGPDVSIEISLDKINKRWNMDLTPITGSNTDTVHLMSKFQIPDYDLGQSIFQDYTNYQKNHVADYSAPIKWSLQPCTEKHLQSFQQSIQDFLHENSARMSQDYINKNPSPVKGELRVQKFSDAVQEKVDLDDPTNSERSLFEEDSFHGENDFQRDADDFDDKNTQQAKYKKFMDMIKDQCTNILMISDNDMEQPVHFEKANDHTGSDGLPSLLFTILNESETVLLEVSDQYGWTIVYKNKRYTSANEDSQIGFRDCPLGIFLCQNSGTRITLCWRNAEDVLVKSVSVYFKRTFLETWTYQKLNFQLRLNYDTQHKESIPLELKTFFGGKFKVGFMDQLKNVDFQYGVQYTDSTQAEFDDAKYITFRFGITSQRWILMLHNGKHGTPVVLEACGYISKKIDSRTLPYGPYKLKGKTNIQLYVYDQSGVDPNCRMNAQKEHERRLMISKKMDANVKKSFKPFQPLYDKTKYEILKQTYLADKEKLRKYDERQKQEKELVNESWEDVLVQEEAPAPEAQQKIDEDENLAAFFQQCLVEYRGIDNRRFPEQLQITVQQDIPPSVIQYYLGENFLPQEISFSGIYKFVSLKNYVLQYEKIRSDEELRIMRNNPDARIITTVLSRHLPNQNEPVGTSWKFSKWIETAKEYYAQKEEAFQRVKNNRENPKENARQKRRKQIQKRIDSYCACLKKYGQNPDCISGQYHMNTITLDEWRNGQKVPVTYRNESVWIESDYEIDIEKNWHFTVKCIDDELKAKYGLTSFTSDRYTQRGKDTKKPYEANFSCRGKMYEVVFDRNRDGILCCFLYADKKFLYSYKKEADQDNMIGFYRRRDDQGIEAGSISITNIYSLPEKYYPKEQSILPLVYTDGYRPYGKKRTKFGDAKYQFAKDDDITMVRQYEILDDVGLEHNEDMSYYDDDDEFEDDGEDSGPFRHRRPLTPTPGNRTAYKFASSMPSAKLASSYLVAPNPRRKHKQQKIQNQPRLESVAMMESLQQILATLNTTRLF